MMVEFEYGGKYKKYDMTKTWEIGGGTLKVHDIFDPLPDFMMRADCMFVDPRKGLERMRMNATEEAER